MNIKHFEKRKSLLVYAAIVVCILAAYEPVRKNGFINYDDNKYIVKNPDINRGITQDSVLKAFNQFHFYMWHPLTTLSHILDCQFFNLDPFWHHLVSVLIHTINAILVFWIFTRMTGKIWPSAFVAAVFAVHPLQVESVAWAAERKTVLSGFFWLLTTALYVCYAKRPAIKRYLAFFLAYALCIMTKPSVVTLPFALLLLDYWPLERIKFGHLVKTSPPKLNETHKISIGRLIVEKIPLMGLSAVLSVVTFIAQKSGDVVAAIEKLPLELRIANAFISYIKYIGKTIWPEGLAVIYPYLRVSISDAAVIICLLLFVLITVLSLFFGLRRRYLAAGWLWFTGTLIPMAGFVQVGSQAMANRYMYISILGLLVMVAWSVKEFVADSPRRKAAAAVSAAIVLFCLIILTRIQVGHWRDTYKLFEYALKVTKNNFVAENGLGCALFESNQLNEAESHLKEALRLCPTYYDARSNLGKVFFKQGKPDKAIECFNELINRKQDAEIYVNLAMAYAYQDDFKTAIQNCAKAEQLKSDNPEVLNNLAWLLATAGDVTSQNADKAVVFAQLACELTAYKNADFLDTLAVAYAAAGEYTDAIITSEKALEAAMSAGQTNLVAEIQNRMKLYKAGTAYRGK